MKNKKLITIAALVATSFGLVSCGDTTEQLTDAGSYLYQMYKDDTQPIISYQLNNKLKFSEETFNVSWALTPGENFVEGSAKIGEVTDLKTTIEIEFGNQKTEVNSNYKLTATITDSKGKESVTREFERFVPKCNFSTIADFTAAKNDKETYVFTGVISAVGKIGEKGSFVLTDDSGTVFSYSGANVTLGDEVVLAGRYSDYNGFPQLDGVEVISVKSQNQLAKAFDETSCKTIDIAKLPEIGAAYGADATKQSTIDEYASRTVKITNGTVTKSGSYYILTTEDHTDTVNIYSNSEVNKQLSALEGKKVDLYGGIRGFYASGKVLTIQTTKVVEAGAAF